MLFSFLQVFHIYTQKKIGCEIEIAPKKTNVQFIQGQRQWTRKNVTGGNHQPQTQRDRRALQRQHQHLVNQFPTLIVGGFQNGFLEGLRNLYRPITTARLLFFLLNISVVGLPKWLSGKGFTRQYRRCRRHVFFFFFLLLLVGG